MSVHMMNVEVAELAGVNAGLIFQSFSYWIDKNAANGKHFHDGLYWTYNSMAAFEKQFPYMPARAIRSAIDKLVEHGLIVKGNYNKSSYDRTTWYAITEKGMEYVDAPNKGGWTAAEGQIDLSGTADGLVNADNSICQKCQMEASGMTNGFVRNGGPIPDNIPVSVPVEIPTDNYADKYPPNPPKGGTGEKSANASVDGASKPKREPAKTTEPLSADEEQSLTGISPRLCDIVREWLQYKAGKRQTYTPVGKKKLLNKIRQNAAQFGADAMIEAIDAAMANNWQGIVWDKISQPKRGNAYHGGGYGTRQPSRHVDANGRYRYDHGDTTGSF